MRAARYLFLFLVPAIPLVQREVDRRTVDDGRGALMYLRSGEQVRRLWPGLEDLAADLYWLRTVQYNGRERLAPSREPFAHLGTLLDITTTLDPRLEIAYWYGAIFLSEDVPQGKGAPLEGRALLEKGVRARPESWRLRQNLGFHHYLYLGDPAAAGRLMLEAARLPGAPFWLESLAANLLTEGRERERARSIWLHIHEQAPEGVFRENARYHLDRLDALDIVDAWNDLARRYTEAAGRPPRSLEELAALAGGRIPTVDRAGVPFDVDPRTGTVSIARRSRLWRHR